MKRMILVHGDKGGTGKSHIAQLTAASFLGAKHPVTLIDGDAKNPGLFRHFDNKPAPVLRINARKPEGIDALIEAFLAAPGDVLIDLPAGGSDTTAGFTGAGSAAGTVDIESLMKAVDGRLTILFVIDQGRDGIVALNDELTRLPTEVTDWIIVRNHRVDAPFDRLDSWAEKADLRQAIILDMPALDRNVVEALVTAKMHIGEIDNVKDASLLMKMRARSALRAWTGELEKAGLLHNG
ncbi:hypothetical protein RNZ50_00610 [Paracoccaceae bacterium Fryx2]|nr:hypothetical protein [Paracoccaceae bacterium Fryx2]